MDNQTPMGYAGKILRIDLSSGEIKVEPLDYSFARKYVGGAGFVIHTLLKEMAPHIEPLSPDNHLIFAGGPVTGQPIPGSGRNCVGAKSPLTGTIAKCETGGFWGVEMKRAGFDMMIVRGKAEHPVYLWIHDGEVEIKDARHIWGNNTKETQQMIRTELGDDRVQVASIGKGGENLVRFAAIMNGLNSAAARGGLGAVMGSKNVKAIAVRGHQPITAAKPQHLKEIVQWMRDNKPRWQTFPDFGTGAAMVAFEAIGNLPIHNWRDGVFPGTNKIDPQAIKATIRVGMEGCFGCMMRCKKIVKSDEGYIIDPAYGGPEYETEAAFGSNCGVDDVKAMCKANELCNAYSLDTITAGCTIAFAMECFEKGILTREDIGYDLPFGDGEAMVKTVELIAERKGIGNILAEGSLKAAALIGKGAEELTVTVKGLEPGQHDPRLKYGLGIGYMTLPTGADHMLNLQDTGYAAPGSTAAFEPLGVKGPLPADDLSEQKIMLLKGQQVLRLFGDLMVVCNFPPYSFNEVMKILEGSTGWKIDLPEMVTIFQRVMTEARLFNLREGFTAADDVLPKRLMQGRIGGALDGKALDPVKLEEAKSCYYAVMGWDSKTGVPTSKKLAELGVS